MGSTLAMIRKSERHGERYVAEFVHEGKIVFVALLAHGVAAYPVYQNASAWDLVLNECASIEVGVGLPLTDFLAIMEYIKGKR